VDAATCVIPVGVTLGLRVEERPGPSVVLRVVPPCGDATWQEAQTVRALDYLAERGVARDAVEIRIEACGPVPDISAEVVRPP
jgi:hypothetical protein